MISQCFQLCGKFDKALVYLKKMLKLAWFLNDSEAELFVYDQIGYCLFSTGKIDQANCFHKRMLDGKIQTKDDHIKAYFMNIENTK